MGGLVNGDKNLVQAASGKLKGTGSSYLASTMVGGVGVQYRGVTLKFGLAIVTEIYKMFSGLYLRHCTE